MAFWIFMLVMDLLIPLVMVGFGRQFMKMAPKEINAAFGYRTGRSMKNRETWEFAHQYIGRLWYVCGLILLPVSVLAMLFVIGKDINTVALIGTVVCTIQLIPAIGTIIPTEIALKNRFDSQGNRI